MNEEPQQDDRQHLVIHIPALDSLGSWLFNLADTAELFLYLQICLNFDGRIQKDALLLLANEISLRAAEVRELLEKSEEAE